MPVWDPDDALTHDVDFRLVSNGFVSMFVSQTVLGQTLDWLAAHEYDVRLVDAASWTGETDMHREIARLLEFPDYYGENLNALDDCLGDVAAGDYGVREGAKGLVLVLHNYDAFATANSQSAHELLDSFARRAGHGALFGNRMMCLVHTNDPRLEFEPVGAVPVVWNDAEWFDSTRGLRGSAVHDPTRWRERREALIALLERVGPVADSVQQLARFPWDCDGELAVLTADHIVRTLQAFLSGQLSEDDVETWAEALQDRDDLGLDPTRADDLKQALFELSTAEICGPMPQLAASWIKRLTAT